MRRVQWLELAAVTFAMLGAVPAPAAAEAMTQGNVSFVAGGVGIDAQQQLQAQEKDYNLKLVFTLVEGNYVADVDVKIADGSGKTVVEHVADGPFFMAKLPSGAYTVTANYEGKTRTLKVKVGKGLHTEYMRWPSNPQTDVVLAPEKNGK